jgi:hypothetical protein
MLSPHGAENKLKNIPADLLQPCELEFAAWFLEDAGADFQDHSADETFMPASDDMLAIAAAIRDEFGDDAPEVEVCRIPGDDADVVQFFTSQAMEFFARRCRELAPPADRRPLNAAELSLMAELLELAGQDHENVADDVSFDLTLDVTAENRIVFSGAIDHYLARVQARRGRNKRVDKQTAATAMAARAGLLAGAAEPTIDIPDFWLMFYLAQRCRQLATAA